MAGDRFMRIFGTGRQVPAVVADEAGERQLVEAHERRAKDTARRLAPRSRPVAPASDRPGAVHMPTMVSQPLMLRSAFRCAIDVGFGPGTQCSFALMAWCGGQDNGRSGWARWFEAADVPADAVPARGPMLADASLSKQAALLGHGVARGDLLQIGDELASGALVKPFDIDVASGAYWLVARNLRDLSEPARAFPDWIRSEFAVTRQAVFRTLSSSRLSGALLLDLADGVDHRVKGEHGRGMACLVVAHWLQIFQVGVPAFGRRAVFLEHLQHG